jgi:hypothetical protein
MTDNREAMQNHLVVVTAGDRYSQTRAQVLTEYLPMTVQGYMTVLLRTYEVDRFNFGIVVLQLVQSFVFTKLQEELEDWETMSERAQNLELSFKDVTQNKSQ